jgi:hypothetical protein
MGRIASELADFAIITSDNPRREDPKAIIDEKSGEGSVGNAHHIIEDRREAIAEAIQMATSNDVVIVAGERSRGLPDHRHEMHHFSDREVIEEFSMWLLEDVISAVKGTPLRVERREFTGISTDSRNIRDGQLFIPSRLTSMDTILSRQAYLKSSGEASVRKAKKGHAESGRDHHSGGGYHTGALDLAGSRGCNSRPSSSRSPEVMGRHDKRAPCPHHDRICSAAYNEKNYNNHRRLPDAPLHENQPQYCVLGLGTNHQGEIALLARLVEPDLSTITNVNASHLRRAW